MSIPVYRINIADKIKEYREQHELSLKGFGKRIGVSAQAVWKWERGICYPDIIFLPHLARVLECSMEDFFEN